MGKCFGFIGKEMETIIRILKEIPTGKAGHIYIIACFKYNLVRCCTPALSGQWILTVEIIIQILIKPENTTLKI